MNVEIVLMILAVVLCVVGVIGCVAPALPGPPLSYAGMLLVQWLTAPFSVVTLVIFGILALVIIILDYYMPIWFAQKFGATRQGIIGSIIGMVLGFFFTPIGMILGLLIGAIVGDMVGGRSSKEAAKSGIATFLGTLFAIGLKLSVAALISFFVVWEVVSYFTKVVFV
jgi:uncharacterized protein YqgC (DUF456 family)